MTVAAVILAASPDAALAAADGTPAVRRIADSAWAGGATPVVVVADDPDGAVAAALATAEVALVAPGPADSGVGAHLVRGAAGAAGLVAATSAVLVWPSRFAWADAETVTTLIHAHGDDPAAVLRPVYGGEAGWPALLPLAALDRIGGIDPARQVDEIVEGVAAASTARTVDTGDPGATNDITVPRSALPPFDGPPRPEDGLEREWGAPAAGQSDDAPPSGPARLGGAEPVR